MPTLEILRRRIDSAEDLHAVVRVMKALAAASIRHYEKAVEALAAYGRTIELGLQAVLRQRPPEVPLQEEPGSKRWGMLVVGSDQGMCGSFNEQIAGFFLDDLQAQATADRTVLVAGSRLIGRLEDAGITITKQFQVPFAVQGITPVVDDVLLQIEEMRFREGIAQFMLYHHQPVTSAASIPHKHQLLPLATTWLQGLQRAPWTSRSLPAVMGDWAPLFAALVRQHLFMILCRAFAASMASENASRLAAMQAAEQNIMEHLAELTAFYHQQRQQAITEELLDIIAGFESLTSPEPA